jgi:segregation and condensation protein B
MGAPDGEVHEGSAGEPDPSEGASPEGEANAAAVDDGEAEAAPEGAEPAARVQLEPERIKHVLESLLFVADRILTAAQLARAVHSRVAEVRPLLAELIEEYRGRGIELCEVGGGYQFRSSALNAEFVREMVAQRPVRLTRAQLETLALVAYRQPITRPEIDDVRGVDTGSAVKVLLERNLIKLIGRKDEPGRPLLYGTTPYFLEFFGMKSLGELPTLKEFTELSDENRELFQRKTGEDFESAQHDLQQQAEAEQERLAQLAEQELDADLSAPQAADEDSARPDAPPADSEDDDEDDLDGDDDEDGGAARGTPAQAPGLDAANDDEGDDLDLDELL